MSQLWVPGYSQGKLEHQRELMAILKAAIKAKRWKEGHVWMRNPDTLGWTMR